MNPTTIPQLAALTANADHVDVKTFRGQASMRAFLAALFSYSPAWLKGLYGVRAVFVRLLGMKQEGIPMAPVISPEDISLTPGDYVTFFKVEDAQDESFYISSAKESHLDAYLAVVVDGDASAERDFHLITIVHYNNWKGPVYFNVIRPFHHLVVRAMGNAALKQLAAAQPATAH